MAIIEDLIVSDYGAYVGLHGQRIRMSVPEQAPIEAPLLHLRSIQIHTQSASISAAALAACCAEGIPIHFVDSFHGNYATILSSTLNTVVVTRRAQLAAFHSPLGLQIAQQIAIGKIKSQAANLRYLARRQSEDLAEHFKDTANTLLDHLPALEGLAAQRLEDLRASLMGQEGHCASLYWQALARLIPEDYAWPGRTGRYATDAVNMLLNYGYAILYGEVQNALALASLEPYLGLIHTDRPGKPSLTLDLIEEFRAPVVDRTVIGLVNRHYEVKLDENGRLERELRKNFAEHILSRLQAQGAYQGKRYTLRAIIQHQARALAAAFRGEKSYQAYTGG